MPASVSLKAIKGPMTGKEFKFGERTTCIIGRASDCNLVLPADQAHKTVSRHHCLLDIVPPGIRIRDFGSLNGTFVNGVKIGQRKKGETPEEAARREFPEHDLVKGDLITLGKTVFQVDTFVPAVCAGCFREISEQSEPAALKEDQFFLCRECREESAGKKQILPSKTNVCVLCGKESCEESPKGPGSQYVCPACRADPLEKVKEVFLAMMLGRSALPAIENHTILKELGRGGMGLVYLARHEKLGREVALKVMLASAEEDKGAVDQFFRECRNHEALSHPNVVRLYEHGRSNGIFYLAMEYCSGASVERLLCERGGKLPVDAAMEIILQALEGLSYVHNAEIPQIKLDEGGYGKGFGLVHRDLKPGNILLAETGGVRTAKIADVGLAKAFDLAGLSGFTKTGQAAGTPEYMPRQQVIKFKYARPDVDVWAMAATLYHMLTGRPPRDFPPGKDRWLVVLQTRPVPIRNRDPSIPQKLAEVIDHALRDEPEIGFKTAVEFRNALVRAL